MFLRNGLSYERNTNGDRPSDDKEDTAEVEEMDIANQHFDTLWSRVRVACRRILTLCVWCMMNR